MKSTTKQCCAEAEKRPTEKWVKLSDISKNDGNHQVLRSRSKLVVGWIWLLGCTSETLSLNQDGRMGRDGGDGDRQIRHGPGNLGQVGGRRGWMKVRRVVHRCCRYTSLVRQRPLLTPLQSTGLPLCKYTWEDGSVDMENTVVVF